MYDQGSTITDVVRGRVEEQKASLSLHAQTDLDRAYAGDYQPSLPDYQKRNWLLARETYALVAHRDGLRALTQTEERETQLLQVPGRMDIRTIAGREIIMDGAHNEQKMRAFVQSYQAKYGNGKVPVLMALKQGKEIADVASLITTIASEVIVTTFSKIQDLPIVSMDPQEIADALKHHGVANLRVTANQEDAYQAFLSAPGDRRIITGSFFLISQLRDNHPELKQ